MTSLAIRLSLKDAEVVKRGLQGIGAEGEAALRKLEKAAADTARGGGGKGFRVLEDSGKSLSDSLRRIGDVSQLLPSSMAPAVAIFGALANVVNPLSLTVAAVAGAIAFFTSQQSAAERATESHGRAVKAFDQALEDVGGTIDRLSNEKLGELEVRFRNAAIQARAAVEEELGKLTFEIGYGAIYGDLDLSAPELKEVIADFAEGEVAARDFIDEVVRLAAENPSPELTELADRLLALIEPLAEAERQLAANEEKLGKIETASEDASRSLSQFADDVRDLAAALSAESGISQKADEIEALRDALAGGGLEAYRELEAQQRAEAAATKEVDAAMKEFTGTAREAAVVRQVLTKEALENALADQALAAEVKAAEEAQRLLELAQKSGAATAKALATSWTSLHDRLDPLGAAVRRYHEELALVDQAEKAGIATAQQAALARDRLTRAYLEAADPFAAVIAEMRAEREALSLGERARTIAADVLARENQLRAQGIELTQQQRDAIEDEATANYDAAQARQNLQQAESEALAAAERTRSEVESVAKGIADDWADLIYQGAETGFDNILGDLKVWLRRIGLEIAKQQFILPITTQIVGAAPALFGVSGSGGAAGSLGGALNDAFSGIGQFFGLTGSGGFLSTPISQLGGAPQSILPPSLGGSVGTFGGALGALSFGDFLGGAGTGLGLGSLVGSLTGNTGLGPSIGGTLGGLAGTALSPFLGPAGPIVGGLLGGFIGSLFGGEKPLGPQSIYEIRNARGLGPQQIAATQGAGDPSGFGASIVEATENLVEALGGALGGGAVTVDVGQVEEYGGIYVNPTGFYGDRAGGVKDNATFFGQDAAAARRFAVSTILAQAGTSGIDPEAIAALRKSLDIRDDDEEVEKDVAVIKLLFDDLDDGATGAEAALKELNATFDDAVERARELGLAEAEVEAKRAEAIEGLKTGFADTIRRRFLAIEDPLALALEDLDTAFDQLRADAEVLGYDLVEIERLYALERQQVIEQFAQNATSSLRDLLAELQYGDLSGLDALDRLAGSRAAYREAEAAAGAGDVMARAELEALARAYYEDAFAAYGNTGITEAVRSEIRSALEVLIGEVPGYALGTDFHRGGLAVVGERGPELLRLPRGSAVTPAGETAALLSGALGGGRVLEGGLAELARLMGGALDELRALRDEYRRLADAVENGAPFERRLASLGSRDAGNR